MVYTFLFSQQQLLARTELWKFSGAEMAGRDNNILFLKLCIVRTSKAISAVEAY